MCQSTTAIYCFLDDLLKAINHQEDAREQINDAQVLTTALIAMLDFGGNYQKALHKIEDARIFSRSLSRSCFSRRTGAPVGFDLSAFSSIGNNFQRPQL